MEKALCNLKRQPDKIMVDGFALPLKGIKSEGVIKGDEKIEQISAASITAKVARDKFMKLVDSIFPEYEFKKERDILDKSNKVAGEKGIRSYWESSNTKSLDGLKTNIIEKNIGK